jgi:hypothetical protein
VWLSSSATLLCGSACGSVWQCARLCAAVRPAVCGCPALRQCAAVRQGAAAQQCVAECGQCAAVQQSTPRGGAGCVSYVRGCAVLPTTPSIVLSSISKAHQEGGCLLHYVYVLLSVRRSRRGVLRYVHHHLISSASGRRRAAQEGGTLLLRIDIASEVVHEEEGAGCCVP